ncbi:hypothetical protein FACS189485_17940 [Spirochaetia bacterium]|nr:hypothetical protein FACS189485_17940 [Spirochaetia bacterium]
MISLKKASGIAARCLPAACLLAACLLTTCDIFNKPIEPFLDSQTGEVRVLDLSGSSSVVISSSGDLILIPPASEEPESIITVNLENSQGYNLRAALNLTQPLPAGLVVTVDDPNEQNQIMIHITGAGMGHLYNLVLDIRIDGMKRIFDALIIPPIFCRPASTEQPFVTESSMAIIDFFLISGGTAYRGEVNEDEKTVAVTVPAGTDRTNMLPYIIHSGISTDPVWGTLTNFSAPKTYKVKAMNGSTFQQYTVTVSEGAAPPASGDKAITAFNVSETPIGQKYWGNIDEPNHTVVVTVPSSVTTTALSNMTAAVSYIGASIASDLGPQPDDPTLPTVTFTGVNFSTSSRRFTVKAADDSPQDYTVTVFKEGTPPPAPTPPPSSTYVAFRPAAFTGARDDGYYISLSAAVIAATTGTNGNDPANPDTIILIADDSINSTSTITIPANKHIRLTSSDPQTITRDGNGFGSLITVAATGSLELGGNLVIDGGAANTPSLTATAALITVNGTLKMGGSVTLRNNNNTSGRIVSAGGVSITGGPDATGSGAGTGLGGYGDYSDYGGYGGGVYVNGGTFTMSGGSISGNHVTITFTLNGYVSGNGNVDINGKAATYTVLSTNNGGGGVYMRGGTFTMSNGTIENNAVIIPGITNTDTLTNYSGGTILISGTGGGGVYVHNGGIFTMSDGTINDNSANNGGGVYITGAASPNTSYFTKSGGTIGTGNTVPNNTYFPKVLKGFGSVLQTGTTAPPWDNISGQDHIGTLKVDGTSATGFANPPSS